MKRYIKANYEFSNGWFYKSDEELEALGYMMDPEYMEDDLDACKSYGFTLEGYAINEDSNEIALVCRDDAGNVSIYEHVNGRLYEVEE